MLEKGKISPRQAMWLIISFLLGSAIILIPSAVAAEARQDAWLAIMLATAAGLFIIAVYTSLALRFPGKNYIQLCEIILGKYPGSLAGLAFIWLALHLGSLVVRNFGDFLNATILQHTPMAAVNAIVSLLAVMTVKKGLEVMARVNDLLLPLLLAFILFLTVVVLSDADVQKLLPVLENGIRPVIRGALPAIGFPFAETALFTMIIPCLHRPGEARRSLLLGGLAGGALLLVIVLQTLLVMGPASSAKNWYPTLEAVFLERAEVIIIINWIFFGFMKITVCLYAFALGLAQWAGLKEYRPLALPAGVIMAALSMYVYDSYVEEAAFAAKIWFPYAMPVTLIIPLAMLIIARAREKDTRGGG